MSALAMLRRGHARGAAVVRAVVVTVATITLAALAPGVRAQDVLPVPTLVARVMDQTGTLGPQREALEEKLAEVERTTGSQIVVLMVPTTQPEDIASYAYRVADSWKIGRRDVGDGILVVVAKDDRHVRIEVAKALEGAVPDLAAYQIIDRAMRPAFKAGDYAGGLSAGVDQLAARLRGENLPLPEARGGRNDARAALGHGRHGNQDSLLFFVVGVLAGGWLLKAMLGRTLGSVATGAGAGAIALWSGAGIFMAGGAAVAAILMLAFMGRGMFWPGVIGAIGGGRGGGFGGGGGGFSSGGGGDFGGGGASGNW